MADWTIDPLSEQEAVNAKSYILMESAAKTATGTEPAFQIPVGRELVVTLNVSAASGTTPTLDVKLQHSPDGTQWADLGTAFAQKTAAGLETKAFTGLHGYVRVSYTIGGTTPSFTFSVYATGRP